MPSPEMTGQSDGAEHSVISVHDKVTAILSLQDTFSHPNRYKLIVASEKLLSKSVLTDRVTQKCPKRVQTALTFCWI